MSSSLNMAVFLLTTTGYYMGIKPYLTLDILIDPDKYKSFVSNSYTYLALYLMAILVTQYFINVYLVTDKCGGDITDNLGITVLITFLPWTLMFGLVVAVLMLYPGFKSAFSDVIGYFYVASSANSVLSDLLIDKDVQDQMSKDVNATPQQKEAMQDVAGTIIKIAGNASILINQIVPENFINYWKLLNPLMKTKYQLETAETDAIKKKLFDLVVTRDNVGEILWFIYTGLLVTSLIQLNMSTQACKSNPATMQKKYQDYLDSENKTKANNEKSTSQVYTMS